MSEQEQRDYRHPLCGKKIAMTVDNVCETFALGHAEQALPGATLFLHISNMSERYVASLSELLSRGDVLDVIVLFHSISRAQFNVSRVAVENAQKLPMGSIVHGLITVVGVDSHQIALPEGITGLFRGDAMACLEAAGLIQQDRSLLFQVTGWGSGGRTVYVGLPDPFESHAASMRGELICVFESIRGKKAKGRLIQQALVRVRDEYYVLCDLTAYPNAAKRFAVGTTVEVTASTTADADRSDRLGIAVASIQPPSPSIPAPSPEVEIDCRVRRVVSVR